MEHSEPSLVSSGPPIQAALYSFDGEGTSGTETSALVCSLHGLASRSDRSSKSA